MIGRHPFRPDCVGSQLEPRELLSGTPSAPVSAPLNLSTAENVAIAADIAASQAGGSPNLFHQNGISGTAQKTQFTHRLNGRLRVSAHQADSVTAAFRAFKAADLQLVINPPAGTPPGPTQPALLANLKTQVDFAVTHDVVPANANKPLVLRGLKMSKLQQLSVLPFADTQLATLDATLAKMANVPGPNGTMTPADPTNALNIAVNGILNAVAEQSIHPNLFQAPSDFYLTPNFLFTINFKGAPAASSLGFFVRGPHGALLPGAPVPANYPPTTV